MNKKLSFVLASLLIATIALADRDMGRASSNNAQVTRGIFKKLPDAGFQFEICGTTTNTVDGGAVLLESPCIFCEPGAFVDATSTCARAWKTANGL